MVSETVPKPDPTPDIDNSGERDYRGRIAQIAEVLRGSEFAVEGLALGTGYGKTKVQHLEAPFVRGLETYKTERAFPDAGCSSSAAAVFSNFQKSFFLRSIARQ